MPLAAVRSIVLRKVERIVIPSKGILEEHPPLEGEVTIAVDGGKGDLFERFVGPAWRALQGHVKCNWICIGRGPEDEHVKARLFDIARSGLVFLRYLQRDDLLNRICNGREKVDGWYISTPPVSHNASAIPPMHEGLATAWEKPLTIATREALEHAKQLDRDFPNTMFPVDFFMTSKALLWLLGTPQGNGLLNKIGTISEIHGRCIETQLVEPHRGWLTAPETSGGGVGGIDMSVHPIAMMEMILNKIHLSLDNAFISDDGENVVMARYKDAPGNDDVETFMWTRAFIPNDSNPVKLIIDSGKGTDTNFYGLKVIGKEGELTIGCGTEFHPPFVYFNPSDESKEPVVVTFPGAGVGYGATIYNFNQFIRDREANTTPDVPTLKRATTNSIRLVADGYEWLRIGKIQMQHTKAGEVPDVPEEIVISEDANGLVPPLKTQGRLTVNR